MNKVSWHIRYASGGHKKQSSKDFIQYYYLNNWFIKVVYADNGKPKCYQAYNPQGKLCCENSNLTFVKDETYKQMLIENNWRVVK